MTVQPQGEVDVMVLVHAGAIGGVDDAEQAVTVVVVPVREVGRAQRTCVVVLVRVRLSGLRS